MRNYKIITFEFYGENYQKFVKYGTHMVHKTTYKSFKKYFKKRDPYTGLRSKGEKRYNSILSLASALEGGGVASSTPRPLHPREKPGTHCTGGWLGPRAGLEGCENSRPYRDSMPGPSNS
jgi:hypothetical protein